MKTKAACYT